MIITNNNKKRAIARKPRDAKIINPVGEVQQSEITPKSIATCSKNSMNILRYVQIFNIYLEKTLNYIKLSKQLTKARK